MIDFIILAVLILVLVLIFIAGAVLIVPLRSR